MWLLDHNLPRQVYEFLKSISLTVETTHFRGWGALSNGHLVKAAIDSGFVCILTKDVLFRESAAKTLKIYPQFSIVLITLPQQKGTLYAKAFQEFWAKNPIKPTAGQLVIWPEEI